MKNWLGWSAFLVASTALSGCVETPLPGIPSGETGHSHDMPMLDFALELSECREGGGVSLYNMEDGDPGPTEPFRMASISDDTGNPTVASYGQPIPPGGATWGIWHITTICESYAVDGVAQDGPLRWGWVGIRVYAPPWDTSGIERQYFVADLSFGDDELVKRSQAGGVHASRLLDAKIDWVAPMTLHTVLDDEDHGVFETHAKMKDHRDLTIEPIRFWMLIPVDGGGHAHGDAPAGGYRPISFDLVQSGSGKHLVVDGTGWLSHTRTDAHGAVPGAAGNVGGMLWTGFDRVLTPGPAPNITLAQTWTH